MDYVEGKHHIGLGIDEDNLEGYILQGGYRCVPQKEAAPQEFGGDEDVLSAKSMSRWTQDDFSGGAYLNVFGADPAMYEFSINCIPSLLDGSLITMPPLQLWADTPLSLSNLNLRGVFATGAKVALVRSTVTEYYDFNTGALSTQPTATNPIIVACHDPNDNYIYGMADFGGNVFKLRRYTPSVVPATIGGQAPPNSGYPTAIMATGSDFLVILGGALYLIDVNEERTTATYVRIGRLPGQYRSHTVLNGMTYILLSDAEQSTSVVVYDGTRITPVVELPYNFVGNTIEAYGGRLYVGGGGTDMLGAWRYAELYEITGATLRLVMSFQDHVRAGDWYPSTIFDFVVHEGLLWIGTDQGFLHVYDQTRDALFGGPIVGTSGAGVQAWYLLSTREKLFSMGFNPGTADFSFFRSTSPDDPGEMHYPQVRTSEFAPQPYRDKRWSQISVFSRYGAVALRTSQDGGETWTSHTWSGSVSPDYTIIFNDFDLSGLDPSPNIKFEFTMARNDVLYTELVSFTTTFMFLDSGRRAWAFTLNAADNVEGMDQTSVLQDSATMRAILWNHWIDRDTLIYKDLDGLNHQVIINDINEDQPLISPPLGTSAPGAPEHEAFFGITLTEI